MAYGGQSLLGSLVRTMRFCVPEMNFGLISSINLTDIGIEMAVSSIGYLLIESTFGLKNIVGSLSNI